MNRLKLIITVIISLLAAVVILQNTLPIAIRFLFWETTLPAAIWLIIVLLIGFIAGLTAALFRRHDRRPPGEVPQSTTGKHSKSENTNISDTKA